MASSNMMSCYSLSNLEDVLQTRNMGHSHWTITSHPENVHSEPPPSLSYMSSELDPGKVHEIRVTGIEEGIKKFVVQVKGCGNLRLELQQKLEKVCLQPLRMFVRGGPCLSVYYRNGTPKICRGLITFCVKKKCYVYFVDYGHVELVDLGGLYEIPEELVNVQLQAYRVSLANAHDLYHLEGCTTAFTDLVTCKSLQFRCQVVDSPQGIMMYDQNGRNIKDLILLRLAKVPLKDLAITHIERTKVNNSISRPEAPLTIQASQQNAETKEHLFVTFVHSVGKFFGQLERLSMKNLTRMQSELRKTYSRLPQDPLFYADGIHHVGDAAIIKWSVDDQYYRVVIREEYTNEVVVWFLDYGNVLVVPKRDILAPSPRLTHFNQPAFGIFCQFRPPVSASVTDAQWTYLLMDQSIVVEITECQNDVYTVKLTEDPENKKILDVLYPPPPLPSPPSPQSLPTPQPLPSPPVRPEVKEEGKIYISHIQSAHLFWVQDQRHEAMIASIQQHLFDVEEEPKLDSHQLIVGPVYAVLHPKYRNWYRARLKSIDVNSVQAHFIDYGDLRSVPMTDIRPCPDEIKYFTSLSNKCALKLPSHLNCSDDLIYSFLSASTDSILEVTFDGYRDDVRLISSLVCRGRNIVDDIIDAHERALNSEAEAAPVNPIVDEIQNDEKDEEVENKLVEPEETKPSMEVEADEPAEMNVETETWMEIEADTLAEANVDTKFVVSEPADAEDDPAESFEDLDPPAEIAPETAANPQKENDGQIEPPEEKEASPQNRPLPIDPEFLDCIIDWIFIVVIICCLSFIFNTSD